MIKLLQSLTDIVAVQRKKIEDKEEKEEGRSPEDPWKMIPVDDRAFAVRRRNEGLSYGKIAKELRDRGTIATRAAVRNVCQVIAP